MRQIICVVMGSAWIALAGVEVFFFDNPYSGLRASVSIATGNVWLATSIIIGRLR